jgi:hypothetical protein
VSRYAQWISHKGQRLLYADYSGLVEEEEYLSALGETEQEILKQPPGQMVPLLLNMTNTWASTAITDRAKRMTDAAAERGIPDSPTAIVGVSGFQRAVVQAMQFVRRDLHLADSLEAGKEWLVQQMRQR